MKLAIYYDGALLASCYLTFSMQYNQIKNTQYNNKLQQNNNNWRLAPVPLTGII